MPSYKFNLQLDQIDLDRYIPANDEVAAGSSNSSGGALLVPMAAFKDINANGQFKAGKVVSGGLELDNIDVQIGSSPGNVAITPRADLYQGKLDGDIAFKQTSNKSELNIQNEIDLVALGELLTAADISDQLTGIGSLVLDLLVVEQNGVQSNEGTIKVFAKMVRSRAWI